MNKLNKIIMNNIMIAFMINNLYGNITIKVNLIILMNKTLNLYKWHMIIKYFM
jgi:hypothetical protein